MQIQKIRIISYILVMSLCVSLWSPAAANRVFAQGNSENTVKYELLFQDSEGVEITSLDMSDKEKVDLFSFVKVMKTEGTDTVEVDKKEQEFVYVSSNKDAVTVSEDGNVTIKPGSPAQTVDISVTWTDSSDSATDEDKAEATFHIHIKPLIGEIEIAKAAKTLIINDTYDLSKEVSVMPEGAAGEISYKCTGSAGVVSVSDGGLLKAEKEGTTAVTVSSKDNPEISDTITVTVIDVPVALELNQTAYSMKAADTFRLSVQKVYASGKKEAADEVTFVSSNEQVVTVDADGLVTGCVQQAYPATAQVTASSNVKYMMDGEEKENTISASCQFTITSIPIEQIIIENKQNGATWEITDTYTLKTKVLPENATDKTVSYKTSDKNVATVSQSGVITAAGIGKATITAYAKENSAVMDQFEVNVYQTSFDIVKLGVNGTDKSNDATKINKILKYATKVNEPITVIVPDGTYYISSVLKVYPKTNIILSDHAVIKRMQSAGGSHMLMNYTDSKGKGYTQCQDITITGGTWDGNATGAKDANCLYFGHAKNITITNTTIKNNSGAHLLEFAGVQNALVENVELYGYTMCKEAGYTALQSEKEAIQLDYCSSVSAPAMKPHDGTACDNITIRNCNIHDYMAGIGTHTEGAKPSTNIKIERNTFKSITNACINLRNFSNITISNNTAKNCTTFVYASGSKGTIKNNKVTNGTSYKPVTTSGLRAKNGITISNGSNFTVQGNTFEKAKSNGICVWNKSTAVIQNNKIKNNKLYGIRTQGSKITLKKNSFSKNSKGLYDTYKDATVKSSDDIRAYYIDIKKSYKYKGKAVKPKIKIKGLNKKYYKVSYKNCKKPGTATVTIKGKGKVKQTLKIKYKISR